MLSASHACLHNKLNGASGIGDVRRRATDYALIGLHVSAAVWQHRTWGVRSAGVRRRSVPRGASAVDGLTLRLLLLLPLLPPPPGTQQGGRGCLTVLDMARLLVRVNFAFGNAIRMPRTVPYAKCLLDEVGHRLLLIQIIGYADTDRFATILSTMSRCEVADKSIRQSGSTGFRWQPAT